ncbi:nitrate- and nitrite sensing domain-containing protein [Streptomyces sp. DW26H14]|uniref:nitrate- and nitrite sensing domain-containing protein n=1 Tax=Streptomyces sp. DW26H14 TaxID=3435395 RepID=UPI00403DF26E
MHSGTPMGRRKRVRTRLVAGVAVTGIVVVAAGTPVLLHASAQLDDAQRLLTLARLDRQVVVLSRSLADERDQVVVFVAAGRPAKDTGDSGDAGGSDGDSGGHSGTGDAGAGGDDTVRSAGDRVDQQITEVRATLAGSSVPAAFSGPLKDLSKVPSIRGTAVRGKGSAIAAYTAYSQVITSLHGITERFADRAPASAAPGARADADLDLAVGQASATRGLLLAALTVPVDKSTVNPLTGLPMDGSGSGTDSADSASRDALSTAAQLARVRELAALADFDGTADDAERRSYADSVTGADVKSAESYLDRLTATPHLSDQDLDTDRDKLNTALTGRIDQMRSAQSGLGADQLKGFEKLRDDAVQDLELRAGLVVACLVVAVAVSAAVARSLTRPLAAVRLGTARLAAAPAEAEPVRFTGRNDEFAEVVRSVNTLHATLLKLTKRTAAAPSGDAGASAESGTSGTVAADTAPTATAPNEAAAVNAATASGQGSSTLTTLTTLTTAARSDDAARTAEAEQEGTDGTAGVRATAESAAVSDLTAEERAGLQAQIAEVTGHLRQLRHTVRHTFVNLSLRNLGLVERQLGVIESLEEREQDPERLATLYKLDHMATVMRRHSENLLVLAEHEQSHAHAGPVPLVDVLRAAVSEIERYERITIQTIPPRAQVVGYAADDLSHLVAELLENAASFSPPEAGVELSGWLLESGEVMLSVVDQGIGVTDDRLAALNARLAAPSSDAPTAGEPSGAPTEGLGLRVTALLAARHGARVELRRQQQDGGTTAVVILPRQLLTTQAPAEDEMPTVPGAASELSLPGSATEAGTPAARAASDTAAPHDPLIAAAEATVRAAEHAGTIPTEAGTAAGATAPGVPAVPVAPARPAGPPTGAGTPRVPEARLPQPRGPQAADGLYGAYAIGPDSHERANGDATGGLDQGTFTMPRPEAHSAPGRDLPKRVPKAVRTAGTPVVRKRGVDPEELRRRLGGFHQGAKAGRHDAEEEVRQSVQQPYGRQQYGLTPYEHQPNAQQSYGHQAYGHQPNAQQPYEHQPYADGGPRAHQAQQVHQAQQDRQVQQDQGYQDCHHQQHETHQQHEMHQHHSAQHHTEAAGDTVEEAHS